MNGGWYKPRPNGVWHYFEERPGMKVVSLCGSFLVAAFDSGKLPPLTGETHGEKRCERCERLRSVAAELRHEINATSPAWSEAFKRTAK